MATDSYPMHNVVSPPLVAYSNKTSLPLTPQGQDARHAEQKITPSMLRLESTPPHRQQRISSSKQAATAYIERRTHLPGRKK
ncbi:hypothetical protein [Formivibrio citricus]|uniref:hypothetical protein n=1 Tax=Formivibrio citricus TaxID=83765 RepID=UPI0011603119|nr:hypothetical protein [Formivibrio citricus]